MVTGSASPEGTGKWLAPLARKRALRLRTGLIESGFPDSMIVLGRCDIDWELLLDLVRTDSMAPNQTSVIDIINTNRPTSVLKRDLMAIDHGRTWRYLFDTHFPALRYAQATIMRNHPPQSEPVAITDTEILTTVPEIAPRSLNLSPNFTPPLPPRYWALKSNLIHDAVLVPNIGLEVWLGKQWSISADYSGAWWGYKYRTKLWRYYGGNIELRRYLNPDLKPLTGWHVGIYGELASYDFQLGDYGYQGKVAGGGGIIAGYSKPIGRHFNLDFCLGVGYFGGKYNKCKYIYGMDYWVSRHNRHWIGPTRAEVSLVWLLGRYNVNEKKGGTR